eukprot:12446191-Alexandrium_andersonii.AAC.1
MCQSPAERHAARECMTQHLLAAYNQHADCAMVTFPDSTWGSPIVEDRCQCSCLHTNISAECLSCSAVGPAQSGS